MGTNALLVVSMDGDVGSHAIWLGSVALYIGYIADWPFMKGDEAGRLPLVPYLLENLVFPIVIFLLPLGCVTWRARERVCVLLTALLRCRYTILHSLWSASQGTRS